MEILKEKERGYCHECGEEKLCNLIHFKDLCQHFLALCDGCLGELKKILNNQIGHFIFGDREKKFVYNTYTRLIKVPVGITPKRIKKEGRYYTFLWCLFCINHEEIHKIIHELTDADTTWKLDKAFLYTDLVVGSIDEYVKMHYGIRNLRTSKEKFIGK